MNPWTNLALRRRRRIRRAPRPSTEAERRAKLSDWRHIFEGKIEELEVETLSRILGEKGYKLLSEADDEELRTACREASLPKFVDEVESELPDHPVTRIAAEVAFCHDPFALPGLLRKLQEEFKCLGVSSAATARFILCEDMWSGAR